MNFREAVRALDGRQPEHMPKPNLDRISRLVNLLDQPELTYPTIHITGTNGKTTTARLVTALACAHGLVVGTFISPHIGSVTERLSVCDEPISEEEFAEVSTHLAPYLDAVDAGDDRVTYFEVLTALTFLWCADKPVGLGVFEVGMGGTWDATNVVAGDVAVICPVGLDHRELGSTVDAVAAEKAGIIKEGKVVVVREQRPEALGVIERRAADVGATLLREGREFGLLHRAPALGGQALEIRGMHGSYQDLFIPLFGEESARNAAAAVAALESLLGRALDANTVRGALAATVSTGRMEVAARRPLVVLDGAHNPDAAAAVARALPEAFRWTHLHLVIAAFEDKDVEGVAGFLAPLAARAYACRNSSPRSATTGRVATALRGAGADHVSEHPSVAEALEAARAAAGEDDLILVTGSFYTVADARPRVTGAPL